MINDAFLQPASGPVSTAFHVRLSKDVLDSILQTEGTNVRLELGSVMKLHVGNLSFQALQCKEQSHTDVFRKEQPGLYRHVARVSQRITVHVALNDKKSSSIKKANESILKEKRDKKATLVDAQSLSVSKPCSPLFKPASTPPSSLGRSPLSLPASPSATPVSPHLKHLRTTSASSVCCKNLAALPINAGPMRIAHFLALAAASLQVVVQRTNLPAHEVERVLDEIATLNPATDKYALKDSSYKDLRVWDCKSYSPLERKRVVSESLAAFDRCRYASDHPARLRLERFKASYSEKAGDKGPDKTGTPLNNAGRAPRGQSNRPETRTDKNRTETRPSRSPEKASRTEKNTIQDKNLKTDTNTKSDKNNADRGTTLTANQTDRGSTLTANQTDRGTTLTANQTDRSYTVKTDRTDHTDKSAKDKNAKTDKINTKYKTDQSLQKNAKADQPGHKNAKTDQPGHKNAKTDQPGHKNAKQTRSLEVQAPAPKRPRLSSILQETHAPAESVFAHTSDDDLFALARKFRDTYSKYSKLYRDLANMEVRSPDRIQRLYAMHHRLEAWKSQLWAANPKN